MRDGKSWIQTATGKKFELFEPDPASVDILDIAHALSNLCRYTGHCSRYMSVAEHCVRVSFRCEELAALRVAFVPEMKSALDHCDVLASARWGLLHDAAEAYVNDLSRPLKHQPELALYCSVEKKVMNAIAERFSLGEEPPEVAVADDELLWTEVRDLMQPLHPDWRATAKTVREPLEHVKIAGWMPLKAKRLFLRRFYELFSEEQET